MALPTLPWVKSLMHVDLVLDCLWKSLMSIILDSRRKKTSFPKVGTGVPWIFHSLYTKREALREVSHKHFINFQLLGPEKNCFWSCPTLLYMCGISDLPQHQIARKEVFAEEQVLSPSKKKQYSHRKRGFFSKTSAEHDLLLSSCYCSNEKTKRRKEGIHSLAMK